jgi:hypothetical protein
MFENSNGTVNVKDAMPKTEVVAKAKRKRFTAAEKLRILQEVDACQGTGEVGALLRREGSIRRISRPGADSGKQDNWMGWRRANVDRSPIRRRSN